METKQIIFDMDGTIADLYGVEEWLPKLRNEDPTPYRDAAPLCDMEILNLFLDLFKELGYSIDIVSWGSKGATPQYNENVAIEKMKWLDKHRFMYDHCHVVPYGTPKSNFITSNKSILIDDSEEVRIEFLNNGGSVAIDATKNMIRKLADLLIKELIRR